MARSEVILSIHPLQIPYQFIEIVKGRDGVLVSLEHIVDVEGKPQASGAGGKLGWCKLVVVVECNHF